MTTKVSSLHVSNLLSFDDFDLHFGEGLTVIVGPNGSGKTNVVRVLDLVNKLVDWADDRSRSIAVAPTPAETVLSSYVQAMHNDPPPGTPIDERLGALRSELSRPPLPLPRAWALDFDADKIDGDKINVG